jgi:hypothetical protein
MFVPKLIEALPQELNRHGIVWTKDARSFRSIQALDQCGQALPPVLQQELKQCDLKLRAARRFGQPAVGRPPEREQFQKLAQQTLLPSAVNDSVAAHVGVLTVKAWRGRVGKPVRVERRNDFRSARMVGNERCVQAGPASISTLTISSTSGQLQSLSRHWIDDAYGTTNECRQCRK